MDKKDYLDWSEPYILYEISQKAILGEFEPKRAAEGISVYTSIEDVIFNWLDGDLKRKKTIKNSVCTWLTLSEMGLMINDRTVIMSRENESWMTKYDGKSISEYLIQTAIPAAAKKFMETYTKADLSKTRKRFAGSMEDYFVWLKESNKIK